MNTLDYTGGLPRELIPWRPTSDPARCRGVGGRVIVCPNNVFEFDAPTSHARVARFHRRTVRCSNRALICPRSAISFPDQDAFLDAVSELRQRAPFGGGSATSDRSVTFAARLALFN